MQGIQLIFNNGEQTPFFRGIFPHDDETVYSIDIDPDQSISGVSMRIKGDNLNGIRFTNEQGDDIINHTW